MTHLQLEAEEVHRRAVVAVVHDHRPIGPDLELMRAGGVTAKVYQVTVDVDVEVGYPASRDRETGWLGLATGQMEEALAQIEANSPCCTLAKSAGDIRRAKEEGKIAILLGAEGTRWLEGSLDPLRLFHRLGLRELQLTWAFPNAVVPDGHLSAFGREVVAECERLGIVVDLTHIPQAAFFEVVECARKPLIVSHGAAAGVTTDLDDKRLKALASTGGLIGVHFYTSYLGPAPTPEAVCKQVDYLAGRIGIDHVALGVDFFPTQGAWLELQVAQGTTELLWAVPDMAGLPLITRSLVEHGYSEEEVRKVLGENFLRVCQEVMA